MMSSEVNLHSSMVSHAHLNVHRRWHVHINMHRWWHVVWRRHVGLDNSDCVVVLHLHKSIVMCLFLSKNNSQDENEQEDKDDNYTTSSFNSDS